MGQAQKFVKNSVSGGVRHWWLVAQKDWLLLSRDKMSLFFTLVFPLLMAVFFGTAFSGGGDTAEIPVAVVDQDNSRESLRWIAMLDAHDALAVHRLPEHQARSQVRRGKLAAMVIVPAGFGKAVTGFFDPVVPEVQLGIDPSRKVVAGMLEGILMQLAAEKMQQAFSRPEETLAQFDEDLQRWRQDQQVPPATLAALENLRQSLDVLLRASDVPFDEDRQSGRFNGFTPLRIKQLSIEKTGGSPANAYTVSFPQGMVWGVMSVLMAFALSIVSEISQGTLSRLLSMPVRRGDILAGKALGCFVTIVVAMMVILLVGVLLFDISIRSPVVLALAIIATAWGFTGLMMLLSVFGRSEKQASALAWPVMLVMAMFGGGMIPVIAMPKWMADLGNFSPVKWTVLSLEGGLWRQFALAGAWPWLALLAGTGTVAFALGRYLFQRKAVW